MAKTNHALVSDLNLTCKLKLEVKYHTLFTSVRFSNVRKHRYEIQVSGFIMQVQVLFTYVCPLNIQGDFFYCESGIGLL